MYEKLRFSRRLESRPHHVTMCRYSLSQDASVWLSQVSSCASQTLASLAHWKPKLKLEIEVLFFFFLCSGLQAWQLSGACMPWHGDKILRGSCCSRRHRRSSAMFDWTQKRSRYGREVSCFHRTLAAGKSSELNIFMGIFGLAIILLKCMCSTVLHLQ